MCLLLKANQNRIEMRLAIFGVKVAVIPNPDIMTDSQYI